MSGYRADRQSIALLRASAALIEDQAVDPGWGMAHSLAELIEQLVSSSGKPAEYFGKGEPPSLEVITMLGERTCCPACGEYEGQHEGWCSHTHKSRAEAATSEQPLHYFGCCPVCHQAGLLTFIGTDDWFVCQEHMIAWYVGSGLFAEWRELTLEQHEANKALVERCERIEQPFCTCSAAEAERNPFESEQPGWLTEADEKEPASMGELLTWLDLSGLPPVPPPEPPARKPTDWRFDAPDGGEQIPF